jgi:hypothetical protein
MAMVAAGQHCQQWWQRLASVVLGVEVSGRKQDRRIFFFGVHAGVFFVFMQVTDGDPGSEATGETSLIKGEKFSCCSFSCCYCGCSCWQ